MARLSAAEKAGCRRFALDAGPDRSPWFYQVGSISESTWSALGLCSLVALLAFRRTPSTRVVDINAASDLVKGRPEPNVLVWRHSRISISAEPFTTAITEADLIQGIAILLPGRRSVRLFRHIDRILQQYFRDHILSFDSVAARAYAGMRAGRCAIGRPVAHAGCLTAIIAGSRGIATATRNVNDFRDCGVTVINPRSTE